MPISDAPASPPVLSGTTRLAGIAGWPVAHSRSPRLHGFWLRRHGIDGAYVPLPIRAEDFPAAARGLRAAGFRGMNVTQPHKLAAFAVCDEVDETARRAGAVNTIVFTETGIRGQQHRRQRVRGTSAGERRRSIGRADPAAGGPAAARAQWLPRCWMPVRR